MASSALRDDPQLVRRTVARSQDVADSTSARATGSDASGNIENNAPLLSSGRDVRHKRAKPNPKRKDRNSDPSLLMFVTPILLLTFGYVALRVGAAYASVKPHFNWHNTKYVYAFGDSYTFVQGTKGHANFSFIGDV